MCQQCIDVVAKHYPNLDENEVGDLLMSATSFPSGTPEEIEKQLLELKENTDGSLDAAINYANERLLVQMDRIKEINSNY